ncbi:hypothetical protein B0T19DRAFT_262766 [Cercophora scortea]|uniref:Uncharacterized protein n=1 Tax=Cercophora scortea TaxID=314031 RepID=A0AAE0M7Y1_9PEZI|nr:hypothetical protein B0T19DRAFT_262766 [Cercophora scortea]
MSVQAREPTLDINGLHHWILEFLIGNRDKLAVLALFFVGLANRPLKPEELAALLAMTKCMKQDGPTPSYKTSRAPGLSLVGRNRPPIVRTASPSLAQRTSLVSSTQTFQEERAREEFWRWVESQDVSRVTIDTMEEEYRSDLESWLDGELFHLLTFQGGVVSLDHPSFKHSIVTFLTDVHPGRMQVLQREMVSSCLTLLCLPRRSKVTLEFDPKTKTHDPPILQYAYAMKNWYKHLKEAGLMGRDIFDLVRSCGIMNNFMTRCCNSLANSTQSTLRQTCAVSLPLLKHTLFSGSNYLKKDTRARWR